ncbi:MAG TPA: hypothetical protein VHM31_25380 [Polyangia bacterium]|nr:hypothetical protein [Polyangia bacterium]
MSAAHAAPPPRLQTVAVLPVTGDNVAPEILSAADDILRDHLQKAGVYAVIEAPRTPPAAPAPGVAPMPVPEPAPAVAAQIGASLGAELAIVVRLTHFGNSARLRLTAYATGAAQVVYWDSILINGGPDELDVAIQRLVNGMKTGKPVRDSAELETVTDKETQALNRREANRSFGLRLTTLLPFNAQDGKFEALTGGGLFWLYDARSWMADVAVDIGGGASGRFFADAALGAYYPLLREDFTPYVGGQIRWAEMSLGGSGASGLTLQPTIGILLGRLSSVQIRVEGGYFFNTYGETGSSYYDSASGTYTTPSDKHYGHGFVFSAGIGF